MPDQENPAMALFCLTKPLSLAEVKNQSRLWHIVIIFKQVALILIASNVHVYV